VIVEAKENNKHIVRLLSYIPGVVIDKVPESNTKGMRTIIGSTIAKLDIALRGFFHPHARYAHPWDIMNFMVYRPLTDNITDQKTRQLVEDIFDHVNANLMPSLTSLRHQVVHHDIHGSNALVDPENLDCLVGIIDFGDMLYAPLIMELVVASDIYLLSDDPIAQIADLVAGYDTEIELEELEVDLLYDLILVRIAMLISICAWRLATRPDEEPHVPEIKKYHQLLDKLSIMGRKHITSRFREACRFPIFSPVIGEQQAKRQTSSVFR